MEEPQPDLVDKNQVSECPTLSESGKHRYLSGSPVHIKVEHLHRFPNVFTLTVLS